MTVSDGEGQTCTANLSAGKASCSVKVGTGAFTLTATYSGNSDYTPASGHLTVSSKLAKSATHSVARRVISVVRL